MFNQAPDKQKGREKQMPDSQGKKKQEMMSFEELYDRHFAAVNRYLRCRVPNFWDADDLTAIVFIKAKMCIRDSACI